MALVPTIKDGDWPSVRQAIAKLASLKLGNGASPTFVGLTLSGLTASRLVQTDANKALTSIADLTSWIAGTTNQITVTSDGDGTVTLSTPQNIHTGASPTFAGLTVTNAINEFSTDGTLGGDSDSAIPTEKAVKTYVDVQIAASTVGRCAYLDALADNTIGYTLAADGWRTVLLDTEVVDTDSLGVLSSNQITLQAGTYLVRASVPTDNESAGTVIQLRLKNITDNSTDVVGMKVRTYISGHSHLDGTFTLASAKVLELQLYPRTSNVKVGPDATHTFGETCTLAYIEFTKL